MNVLRPSRNAYLRLLLLFALLTQLTVPVSVSGKVIHERNASLLSPYLFQSWQVTDGLPFNRVVDIWQDNEGFIIAATLNGVSRFDGIDCELLDDEAVKTRDAKRHESLWQVRAGSVVKIVEGALVEDRGPKPWGRDQAVSFLERRNGDVVVGTKFGGVFILKYDGETVRLTRNSGLLSNQILCLFEDAEEHLWLGTENGLQMLRARPFEGIQAPHHWWYNTFRSVVSRRDGGVWLGSNNGTLYFLEDGKLNRIGQVERSGYPFRALLEDREGAVWMTDYNDGGFLLRFDGDSVDRVLAANGERDSIWVLHKDHDGTAWAGGERGLWHREGNTWKLVSAEGLRGIRSMTNSQDGRLFIGTKSAVAVLEEGKLEWLYPESPIGLVTSLHWDEMADTLWVGTSERGLFRVAASHWAATPFPHQVVMRILEDGDRLWLKSELGISVVEKSLLFQDAMSDELPFVFFGKGDGLAASIDFDQTLSAACQSLDGRLWFIADQQVSIFDPETVVLDENPVGVEMRELVANEMRLSLKGRDSIEVDPGLHRLDIHYSALCFATSDQVEFRCRMLGLGDKWRALGSSRVASFQHLNPGHYVFELSARNRSGIWNERLESIEIVVLPHYWETGLFKALVYVIGIGAIIVVSLAIANLVHRKKLIRVERLRAIEQERNRIAMDIHDEIGSELTQMSMLSFRTLKAADKSNLEVVQKHVNTIKTISQRLVYSLDEIVWVISPTNDHLDNLFAYLAKYVSSYANMAQLKCRIDVPLEVPRYKISGQARQSIYLVVKETLNNTTKHAEASQIDFSIVGPEQGMVEICIKDDGKGFTEEERESLRHGVANMEKRMNAIQGSFSITSSKSNGTQVKIRFKIDTDNYE